MTNQITFFLDLIRLGEEFPKFTPKSSIFTVETKESDVPQCLNRCPVCQCRFFYLTSFVKSCSSHLPEIKALLSETEGAEDSFSQLLTFGQTSKNIEDLAIDSSDVQGESKRTSKQDHDLPQNTDSKVVGLGTFKNEIENTPSTKKHTVSMQSKDHIFVCSICDKTFTRRQTYRDHLLGHENPLIKCCTICSTQFSSGIIASKHKKKFHPELYQRELNERAEERSKHGRSKTIYHTIPKNSSEISTLSENKRETIQTRSLKIVLNRVYLPGFLRNDWIYLPKKIDDYSDCMKKENIGRPNENSIWHFGDNDDCSNDTANNIKPEPQDKLIVEQNDEKQVVWKETKKDSSFYIKPEEIAHIPTFQGAKYIFNIYDERRNKKLKANKEKIKKSKLKRDTSEFNNNSDVEKSKNNTGLFSKAKWGPYKSEPRTCLICGQTRTKSNIRRHVSSHCVEEDDRECRICFTSHAVPNKLREHYSRVHNIKFREYLYKMQKEKMEQSIDETVKSDYVTCNICFTNMKTSEHLKYHYEMLHNYKPGGGKSKGSLDCYICGKIFKEAQTRNLHIRRIHKKMFEGQIFCNYCGKDFMGKGFLLSHFRQVHFDENGHFKESSTKKPKYDNSKNKDKQLFMCEICGEVKETKTTMMKHRNEKHGVLDPEYGVILEKDFEENDCPHCAKHFTSIRKFKDHEKYHLKEQSNLFCEVCGIKCKTDIFLKAHMQRHGEKKFFCEFEGCQKGFAVKYDYLTHKKRAHGSGESFPCKRCDQVFRTWKLRRNHEEIEHGVVKVKLQRNKRLTPNTGYKEDEGGNCRFCGKHFDNYRKWQNHEYHHKKIIPNLHCEICGAKSTTEYNLKRHMERHGKIQYFCEYPGCGKGFTVKHDVRIHARRAHKELFQSQQKTISANTSPIYSDSGSQNQVFHVYSVMPSN